MKASFISGFGPIVRDVGESRRFWGEDGFGLALAEIAPDYYGVDDVGVRAFALWPLSQAAENTFGTADWPADIAVPQAWIELDVEIGRSGVGGCSGAGRGRPPAAAPGARGAVAPGDRAVAEPGRIAGGCELHAVDARARR